MIRVKSDCILQDGTKVPNLSRWQCSACQANFFDAPAMEAIEKVRGSGE